MNTFSIIVLALHFIVIIKMPRLNCMQIEWANNDRASAVFLEISQSLEENINSPTMFLKTIRGLRKIYDQEIIIEQLKLCLNKTSTSICDIKNTRWFYQESVLLTACYDNDLESVKIILAVAQEDLKTLLFIKRSDTGATVLHAAATNCDYEIVEMIIQVADGCECGDMLINALDKNGETACKLACYREDYKVAELLESRISTQKTVLVAEPKTKKKRDSGKRDNSEECLIQ